MPTTTEIDGTRVFRRSPDVVARRVGGESILVPVRQNAGDLDFVYTLSPVAARIWELLDGTATAGGVAETICAEYEVAPAQAAADVAELLADLEGASLVTRVS